MGNVAKYQHGWNMTFTVVELLMIIPKSTYLSISLPYFSIYHFFLLTLFIIDAYMRMSAHYHWQIQWTISVPVILCITIILSLLSFYYFEKPANKWVKRIFTKKTIINQPHGIINKNTTN